MPQKPTMLTNLCLIRDGEKILLAMKKRSFGAGRWNGYGGKVMEGETMEEALVREVQEESGLTVSDYWYVGRLTFDNTDRIVVMDIFETSTFTGELIETEEMAPKWFSVKELPFSEMWPSDPLWYPYYLEGKRFEGEVVFNENHAITSSDIREI
jgi:8-oxo-dGTP pyrophosphatase MutT (NUDIX family)